jgi:spoIIIJ-associated protein
MEKKQKKTKIKGDKLKLIKKLADELLKLMGTETEIKVEEDKKNEAYKIDIQTKDVGLLIGHHGETINSIQTILGMMLRQQTEEWTRIIVNVGDWREKQEEYLKHLAEQAAERVKETGQEQPLYNLSPSQRRIIHLSLSSDPDIETESKGEGRERYLVIKPKKK